MNFEDIMDYNHSPVSHDERSSVCTLTDVSTEKAANHSQKLCKPQVRLRCEYVPRNTKPLTVFSEPDGEKTWTQETETVSEPDPSGVFSLGDLLCHEVAKMSTGIGKEASNKSNFHCKICDKSYRSRSYLKKHYHKNHSSVLCNVKSCLEYFSDTVEMELHYIETHKENVDAVKTHKQLSGSNNSFMCEHCGKIFTCKSYLNQHIRYVHLKMKGFSCKICDRKFRTSTHLNDHIKRHNGIKDLQCNVCRKTFYDKLKLKMHVEDTHSKEIKKYKCLQCNKELKNRKVLNRHKISVHVQDWVYNCNVCSDVYTLECDVKRHYYEHTEQERSTNKTSDLFRNTSPHQCDKCCKYFANKFYLKIHIHKMHNTVKKLNKVKTIILPLRYECNICPKKFKYKASLRKHVDTHMSIKPFACAYCRKSYCSREFLIIHTRIHTKETPFICDQCGDSFISKAKLNLHILKIHDQNKKYECTFCEKKFFVKEHLNIHTRSHTNERPYACYLCSQKFKQPTDLKRHIVRHSSI